MEIPDIDTIANWLQIITSIGFFIAVYKWAKTMLTKNKVGAVVLGLLMAVYVIIQGLVFASYMGWLSRSKVEVIKNYHFNHQTVTLDNHEFYNCVFENSELKYGGGEVFIDHDTQFIGTTNRLTITNKNATRVLAFMLNYGLIGMQPQAKMHLLPPDEHGK